MSLLLVDNKTSYLSSSWHYFKRNHFMYVFKTQSTFLWKKKFSIFWDNRALILVILMAIKNLFKYLRYLSNVFSVKKKNDLLNSKNWSSKDLLGLDRVLIILAPSFNCFVKFTKFQQSGSKCSKFMTCNRRRAALPSLKWSFGCLLD